MSLYLIDGIEVDLLGRWFLMDEPRPPISLACDAGGEGCIQISAAWYESGERPVYTFEALGEMLKNAALGARTHLGERGYTAGGHLVFERHYLLDDCFVMHAFKEQGPSLLNLSYTSMLPGDYRRGVRDAQAMLKTIRLT